MTPAQVIQKKRDGRELSPEEIRAFVRGLSDGSFADYQASALLMAIFFQGLSLDETVALTAAMADSGERLDLSVIPGVKADKHSTGGVGDKVSLILAPLAAACGLKVPMMAGRGLGHTGGTIDKLESISGYQADLPISRFTEIVRDVGCAIMGQTTKIAPADKKLYALRDVTATIDSIPLITASILSKKLAEGTQFLVMDVKVGSGAFMRQASGARALGKMLIKVGAKLGLEVRVLLTDMNQPLGYAAGNALEVVECMEILRGEKGVGTSADLKELTLLLAAHMLHASKVCKSLGEGKKRAVDVLQSGAAWSVFERMIAAQGGDVEQVRDLSLLPKAESAVEWRAWKSGILSRFDVQELGWLLVELGAGRKRTEDRIDPAVGMTFQRKLGASLKKGDVIVTVHCRAHQAALVARLEERFRKAVEIKSSKRPAPKLVLEVLQ